MLVLVYLSGYLECVSTSTDSNESNCLDKHAFQLQVVAISAFCGECAVFLGLILCTNLTLSNVIARNGADRPKTLLRNEAGGWDVDHSNAFDWFILFGEIDIVAPVKTIYHCCGNVNACCCVSAAADDSHNVDYSRLE